MIDPPVSLSALIGTREVAIPHLFHARVRRSPTAPFLLWDGTTWSYEQAWRRIVGFAGFVSRQAATPLPRVATYLGNGPLMMWAWLGTLAAGGVLVPINRGHKGQILHEQLARAGAGMLVTDSAGATALPPPAALAAAGYRVVVLADDSMMPPPIWAADGPELVPAAHTDDADGWPGLPPADPLATACVMFTSGTTGRAKAVCVPHGQYCRGAARLVDAFALRENDVFHNWLPLFHLAGQLHMSLCAVVAGGSVALFPGFSTSEFPRQVRMAHASVLCGFTAILHFLDALPDTEGDCGGSLRVGIFAGIPPELGARIERRFGIRLGENYGMTEADPVTAPVPGRAPPAGSCGLPTPEFEVVIMDERGPLPAGAIGEIAIRPRLPGVMFSHYEGETPNTGRAWRDGWFRTGDFGSADADGFLYFRGRSSAYVRRRGENVSVEELCGLFLRHPAIAECAAVGVPSDVGEDEIKLCYVLKPAALCPPEDLLNYARAEMARFMVPRYFEQWENLPRTDVGKIRLADLREARAGTWDAGNGQTGAEGRRP